MPLSARITQQNRWWVEGPEALKQDTKLKALASSPVRWEPPLNLIDLSQDGVYTLRGQRQVGKSTYLKLLAQEVLSKGWNPRLVMYLDADEANARTNTQLTKLVEDYLTDVKMINPDTKCLVLLDEVTGIKNWQTTIRVLADTGKLAGVTVVATGSNCKDLKTGGDRLPRRRGRILDRDLVMQPLSFRDYLEVTEPKLLTKIPLLGVHEAYNPERVYKAASDVHLFGTEIISRFNKYLGTGGFLVSIAEEINNSGIIPEHVYSDYRAAILGEVVRMGRKESILRPLVYWLRNRLGEEFDWRDLARDTHISNHETVRDLVEDMQSAYVWHIYYRVKEANDCFPALRSPKRLYPLDPFTWHMLWSWSQGKASSWLATQETLNDSTIMGKLAESVVADHIRRMTSVSLGQSHYYRSKDGEEIDFVTCKEGKADGKIEVKYRNSITGGDQSALRHNGGGLLISKETLHFADASKDGLKARGPVAEVPAAYALAMWPARTVFPVRE